MSKKKKEIFFSGYKRKAADLKICLKTIKIFKLHTFLCNFGKYLLFPFPSISLRKNINFYFNFKY